MNEKQGYLVLTRRPTESERLGENVEIIVLDIRGGQVRLGFRAPRSVAIVRTELIDRVPTLQPVA